MPTTEFFLTYAQDHIARIAKPRTCQSVKDEKANLTAFSGEDKKMPKAKERGKACTHRACDGTTPKRKPFV